MNPRRSTSFQLCRSASATATACGYWVATTRSGRPSRAVNSSSPTSSSSISALNNEADQRSPCERRTRPWRAFDRASRRHRSVRSWAVFGLPKARRARVAGSSAPGANADRAGRRRRMGSPGSFLSDDRPTLSRAANRSVGGLERPHDKSGAVCSDHETPAFSVVTRSAKATAETDG